MIKMSCLATLFGMVLVISCSTDSSDSLKQELSAYCIRECVLEIADSEVCDDRCKCAANKLSGELSNNNGKYTVEGISKNPDLVQKLRTAIDECGKEHQ